MKALAASAVTAENGADVDVHARTRHCDTHEQAQHRRGARAPQPPRRRPTPVAWTPTARTPDGAVALRRSPPTDGPVPRACQRGRQSRPGHQRDGGRGDGVPRTGRDHGSAQERDDHADLAAHPGSGDGWVVLGCVGVPAGDQRAIGGVADQPVQEGAPRPRRVGHVDHAARRQSLGVLHGIEQNHVARPEGGGHRCGQHDGRLPAEGDRDGGPPHQAGDRRQPPDARDGDPPQRRTGPQGTTAQVRPTHARCPPGRNTALGAATMLRPGLPTGRSPWWWHPAWRSACPRSGCR